MKSAIGKIKRIENQFEIPYFKYQIRELKASIDNKIHPDLFNPFLFTFEKNSIPIMFSR